MAEKNADQLPKLNTTLKPPPPRERTLELDELWSFVQNKKNQCWIWIALCATTKQIVAFVAGDRTTETCWALWCSIPWRYKRVKCYSDFWEAYQSVIPKDQHEAVGKDSGKTNHVERWNNTLRQRLGQFVRKSLSFSKCWDLHVARLKLFVHRYNLEIAENILN